MNNENREVNHKLTKKRIIIVLLILILFFFTAFGFYKLGTKMALASFTNIPNKELKEQFKDFKDVSNFNQLFYVRDLIYKYYDGDIDKTKLVDGAIKGMTESLDDPYTVYMNKNQYKQFSEKVDGNYVGIGVEVQLKDNKMTVLKVVNDSPAEKAGIKAGDVILKINNKEVSEKDFETSISMIKGKEGTNVNITLFREGKGNIIVDVTRKIMKVKSVSGDMINSNIGYIQIKEFTKDVGNDFNDTLKRLKSKGMNGLILDLRDNRGGYMNECINIASNFIEKGKPIVYTINKYGKKNISESKGGDAIGMPLVVLINGETASASEIVSGAIKDYNLGTLIGEKTYGKGVVQTIIEDKNNGSALKVTISKYYTPSNHNINKVGIKPDIEVVYPKDLISKPYNRSLDPQFQEALKVIEKRVK